MADSQALDDLVVESDQVAPAERLAQVAVEHRTVPAAAAAAAVAAAVEIVNYGSRTKDNSTIDFSRPKLPYVVYIAIEH